MRNRGTRRLSIAFGTLVIAGGLCAATTAGAQAARPTCHGHQATIVGTPGDDELVGTPGSDVIVALDGSDMVRARGGNDIVCGGSQWDEIAGGPGRDRLYGGRGADTLKGGAGVDRLYAERPGFYREPDQLLGGNGDDHLYGGEKANSRAVYTDRSRGVRAEIGVVRIGPETDHLHDLNGVIGSTYADVLIGGPRRDFLDGDDGDDRLVGHGGNDQFDRVADGGNDTIVGGPGTDVIGAEAGDDQVMAGKGGDRIYGFVGKDSYVGGPGYDSVVGVDKEPLKIVVGKGHATGDGTDTRFRGLERHSGGDGADHIVGTDGPDRLSGGYASSGDRIEGRGGDDELYANGTVIGGPGDDTVQADGVGRGGAGDDRVEVGPAYHSGGTAFGGPGDDRIVAVEYSVDPDDPVMRVDVYAGPGRDFVNAPGGPFRSVRKVDGGAGHDTVSVATEGYAIGGDLTIDLSRETMASPSRSVSMTSFDDVMGGDTNDTMIGDEGDNRLVGGLNDDSADGRGGIDTCVAESVTNCEGAPQ